MSQSSKRLSILLDSEVTDLYGPPKLTKEQRQVCFLMDDVEHAVFQSFRDHYAQVYLALLLGYFKIKPVILVFSFSQIKDDFKFIVDEYLSGISLRQSNLGRTQKTRIYQRILSLLHYQSYNVKTQKYLQDHAKHVAGICVEPRYIFDDCIDYLAQNKVAIPGYSHLQRIISAAIAVEQTRVQSIVSLNISSGLSAFINGFLDDNSKLPLSALRRTAKDLSFTEINKELAIYCHIEPVMQDITVLLNKLGLSFKNVEYYASFIDYYTITKLRRFDIQTATFYLLCYLMVRYRAICEHLVEAFIFQCRKLSEDAKSYAKEAAFNEWTQAADNVQKAGQLLQLFFDQDIADQTPFGVVREKALSIIGLEDMTSLSLYLSDQSHSVEYFVWQYYDQHADLVTGSLRDVFMALRFQASSKTEMLAAQISNTQSDISSHDKIIHADRRLIKSTHKPLLISKGDLNLLRYEIYLFQLIKTHLEDGLLYVPASLKYRDLKDDLVSDQEWTRKEDLIKAAQSSRLSAEPNELISTLQVQLDEAMSNISTRIRKGEHTAVVLRNRTGKQQWRLPYKGARSMLNNPFFEQIKQVNLADLLRYVHQEVRCLDAFTHVRGMPTRDPVIMNNLMASIIANGTNYGLYKMAHISDRSYDQMRQVQANYLRLETLHAANDMISNACAMLPIFEYYNIQENLIHASADGQKFESRLRTFKTRYSSKYFGMNKGVSAMTLVANHVPINARVIGANEHESHYIFDLLYNNTSDIKPDMLSTDTHGTNHINYALLDLLGYVFAPRYANFSHVIEELFNVSDDPDKPLLTLKKPIKFELIKSEWDTIQRIVISLQKKTTTQAAIVRKLSSYHQSSALLQALTEYDRLIKSLYILQYIDDANLRGYVQRALNRGEAYHQLRRSVASVNGNRFRGGSDGEIELWNECARLLTNSIVYFNSRILSELLEHYSQTGYTEKLALVKQVSPVAWVNVNLNGTYNFAFNENMLDLDDVISPLIT